MAVIIASLVLVLVLVLLVGPVAGSDHLLSWIRHRLHEQRRLCIQLEEQLARHRIDALTRAKFRAMRQAADEYRQPAA